MMPLRMILRECLQSAIMFGSVLAVFFGALGVVFWALTGDSTAVVALGAWGLIIGVLMGMGNTVIWTIGHSGRADPCTAMPKRTEECQDREGTPVALVYAKLHAGPQDLRALGQLLECWQSEQQHAMEVCGLAGLLEGEYPIPRPQTPVIDGPDGTWTIKDPWINCPVVIRSSRGLSSGEVISSLKRAIPETVGTVVGYDAYSYYGW